MSNDIEKYIVDGKVAVLISQDDGGSWSTWADRNPQILFDPEIVKMVLNSKKEDIYNYVEHKYPNAYPGGIRALKVEWVDVGTKFIVHSHDGYESIWTFDKLDWITA